MKKLPRTAKLDEVGCHRHLVLLLINYTVQISFQDFLLRGAVFVHVMTSLPFKFYVLHHRKLSVSVTLGLFCSDWLIHYRIFTNMIGLRQTIQFFSSYI